MKNGSTLEIKNVSKKIGDIEILQDVSATVLSDTITAFIGPNGAGKTTLFHTITGDLYMDAGEVFFGAQRINGKKPWSVARLGLGKLFQDVRIFPHLSIVENVLISVHNHNQQSLMAAFGQAFKWREARAPEIQRAEGALERVGIEKPWQRPARDLSFGNQKMLAIARLLAGDFKMLLLDEPTAGLSPPMVEKMTDILKDMAKNNGFTIALIEHNFTFVQEVAEFAYLLRAGRVMDSGASRDVLENKTNREVLIGL